MTYGARNGMLHEMLYADDLVLMSESMEDLQRKFSLSHIGKQRNEGQHQQHKINDEWN